MIPTPRKTKGTTRARKQKTIIEQGEKQILFRIEPSRLAQLDRIIAKRGIGTRNAWFGLIVDETIKESRAGKVGAKKRIAKQRRIARKARAIKPRRAKAKPKKTAKRRISKKPAAPRKAKPKKEIPIEGGGEKQTANGAQGATHATPSRPIEA